MKIIKKKNKIKTLDTTIIITATLGPSLNFLCSIVAEVLLIRFLHLLEGFSKVAQTASNTSSPKIDPLYNTLLMVIDGKKYTPDNSLILNYSSKTSIG